MNAPFGSKTKRFFNVPPIIHEKPGPCDYEKELVLIHPPISNKGWLNRNAARFSEPRNKGSPGPGSYELYSFDQVLAKKPSTIHPILACYGRRQEVLQPLITPTKDNPEPGHYNIALPFGKKWVPIKPKKEEIPKTPQSPSK